MFWGHGKIHRCVSLLMMSAARWKVLQMFLSAFHRELTGFCNRTPMSFSIFGRQQRACRPQNKLKYIWYNDTFMKGFQHCQQKQTETLAGQQIFWTPYFREDQCGDLTKQREISNKLRDPAYGAQFHSRTLVFITSYLQAVGCPENYISQMLRRPFFLHLRVWESVW